MTEDKLEPSAEERMRVMWPREWPVYFEGIESEIAELIEQAFADGRASREPEIEAALRLGEQEWFQKLGVANLIEAARREGYEKWALILNEERKASYEDGRREQMEADCAAIQNSTAGDPYDEITAISIHVQAIRSAFEARVTEEGGK